MAAVQYSVDESGFIAGELRRGMMFQSQGDMHRAWGVYRELLSRHPEQADALNLMGVAAAELGDLPQAVALLERAVRADDRIAGFHFNLAQALQRNGDTARALRVYQRVLSIDSMHAEGHRCIGLLLLQNDADTQAWDHLMKAARLDARASMALAIVDGLLALQRVELALGAARAFVGARSGEAALHYALGNALVAAGQWDEAGHAYRAALSRQPAFAEAKCNLARVLRRAGDNEAALALYREAIAINPKLAEAHVSLGIVLREQGDLPAARSAYEAAVGARPEWAVTHFNLANVYRDLGLLEAAIERYQHCLQLDPKLVYGWVNLGNALRARKRHDHALQSYKRALELDAQCIEARLNVGNVLRDMDRLDEAVNAYAAVIELRPAYAEAFNNLGCALRERGSIEAARAACQRAVELKPDYADARYNLGTTYLDEGDGLAAIAHARAALALDPNLIEAHANILMSTHYVELDPARVLAVHREFDLARARELAPVSRRGHRGGGRLRVGYLSSDFRRHSVAYFAEPVLARHDRSRFEVSCYHTEVREDEFTERFKQYSARWTSCAGMTDEELAETIAADGIDILIDLNGFTDGHRALTLARQAAPVQISWLGYPGSTGLEAIDYRISDWQVDPEGYEVHNSERLLRLPGSYFCYRAPEDSPAVGPLAAERNGYITFGSFNNLAKVSDACVRLWADVLRAVPASRLLLKTKALADASVRARTLARFAAAGIAAGRIELLGWEAQTTHHLETYHRVDIALDTWPYNGATTTCEALWMGVPVVSLCGPAQASRMGLSILKALGRVAHAERDAEGFVARAVSLARDHAQLSRCRETLRERLRISPLMDEALFTAHFESALERAWRGRALTADATVSCDQADVAAPSERADARAPDGGPGTST